MPTSLLRIGPQLTIAAIVGGCCAFVPCHPATRIVGVVQARGEPVQGAKVRLFSDTKVTSGTGCFYFDLPSALPLTFAVSADRYKSIDVPAEFGAYRVSVNLAESSSSAKSVVSWHAMSNGDFPSTNPCT